jgi:hypothetical protein
MGQVAGKRLFRHLRNMGMAGASASLACGHARQRPGVRWQRGKGKPLPRRHRFRRGSWKTASMFVTGGRGVFLALAELWGAAESFGPPRAASQPGRWRDFHGPSPFRWLSLWWEGAKRPPKRLPRTFSCQRAPSARRGSAFACKSGPPTRRQKSFAHQRVTPTWRERAFAGLRRPSAGREVERKNLCLYLEDGDMRFRIRAKSPMVGRRGGGLSAVLNVECRKKPQCRMSKPCCKRED